MPAAAINCNMDKHFQGRCIALFPGAFRPPHAAHLTAVQELLEMPEVDEIVIIISNRIRCIAQTNKALDANVARQVWAIYLPDNDKVRVEIAEHTAIQHAFDYFQRVTAGDTLLFCVGEADYAAEEARFKHLQTLAALVKVTARVQPLATASLSIRAASLRDALALGKAGRDAFLTALPNCLSHTQQEAVWRLCLTGMQDSSKLLENKLRQQFSRYQLGEIGHFHSFNPNKNDPVYKVRLTDDRELFVKYAGDTVAPASAQQTSQAKPRRRLGTEKRALNCLSNHHFGQIVLPKVIHFDKTTRTLVLSAICSNHHKQSYSLQDDLRRGVFDLRVARIVGRFLGRCHSLVKPQKPLWGYHTTDLLHWQAMLAKRTVNNHSADFSHPIQQALSVLRQASDKSRARHFLHLDFCPKNILIEGSHIGVIDFESSCSIGDPAYDLGLFLAYYLFWGLNHSAYSDCQNAVTEIVQAYRQEIGALWPDLALRVTAFAGIGLLDSVANYKPPAISKESVLYATGANLLHQSFAVPTSTASAFEKLLNQAVCGNLSKYQDDQSMNNRSQLMLVESL